MRYYRVIGVLGLTLVYSLAQLAHARETFRFSCTIETDEAIFQIFESLYRNAFNTLGYDFTMVHQPSKRSLASTSTGQYDGECVRYNDLLNHIDAPDNLIKVDAPLFKMNYIFWTLRPELATFTPTQLAEQGLRIGYPDGTISLDRLFAQYPKTQTLQYLDLKRGLRMLRANRFDILCAPDPRDETVLKMMEKAPALMEVGVFSSVEFYPYLHQRHANIAPQLANLLKQALSDPEHPLKRHIEELTRH